MGIKDTEAQVKVTEGLKGAETMLTRALWQKRKGSYVPYRERREMDLIDS